MLPQLLSVNEFCEIYAISRTTFYRLVQRGDLTTCKIGSATRIRRCDADAWADSLFN